MVAPYIKTHPSQGYDFNEEFMATEVALFLVEVFEDEAEGVLALFRRYSLPSDEPGWTKVQVALSLYREMHPRHAVR